MYIRFEIIPTLKEETEWAAEPFEFSHAFSPLLTQAEAKHVMNGIQLFIGRLNKYVEAIEEPTPETEND